MTRKEKRFLKLQRNPREASVNEIITVLQDFGYKLKRINGSHFIFKHKAKIGIIVPVHNNKIKENYIKNILKIINKNEEN